MPLPCGGDGDCGRPLRGNARGDTETPERADKGERAVDVRTCEPRVGDPSLRLSAGAADAMREWGRRAGDGKGERPRAGNTGGGSCCLVGGAASLAAAGMGRGGTSGESVHGTESKVVEWAEAVVEKEG